MIKGIFSKINSMLASQYLMRNLNKTQDALARQQDIASTLKIVNRASDNPAVYYSVRKLDKKISDSQARETYLEQSINYMQNNSSYLTQIADTLSEMSTLANGALDVSATTAEKIAIQEDLNQLRESISDILSSGVASKLYNGFSIGGLQNVSLEGTETDSAQPTLAGLTLDGTNINVTGTSTDIQQTITNIDNAYDLITKDEAKLGSYIRRLETEKDTAEIKTLNFTASKSTLEDADLAQTQLELIRLALLQNTTLALISQSNTYSSNVLSLLT